MIFILFKGKSVKELNMSKMTAKNVIGLLGQDKIAERLDVGKGTVNAAFNKGDDGIMPPSWYAAIKEMCDGFDIRLPLNVFDWKAPPAFDNNGEILPSLRHG